MSQDQTENQTPSGDNEVPRQARDDSSGKKNQKPLKIGKIIVDRNLCIGAASCVAIAPGTFQLDSENKAVVYNEKGDNDETILLAAKSCPTRAILVFDEKGNQLYP